MNWAVEKGVLTVSGLGRMADYDEGSSPWYGLRDDITAVRIEDGVTYLGSCAFQDLRNAADITIAGSVTALGDDVFTGCVRFTALRTIGGETYCFDQGTVQTGWHTVNGVSRYFDPASGVMLTGFQQIEDQYYYLPDGLLATGWQTTSPGTLRYFDPDGGVMFTGFKKVGDSWYYFPAGRLYTGWYTNSDGRTRYFNPEDGGAMLTGFKEIDGSWYYLPGGKLYTGWHTSDSGVTRYFDPDQGGAMFKGRKKIDGKWYYLPDGKLYTGWYTDGGGDTRYYDPESGGAMLTGLQQIDGRCYYLKDGVLRTGWREIDGKTYYFDPENGGSMLAGLKKIDGQYYCFRDGVLCTGWQKILGKTRYFDPGQGGAMLTGPAFFDGDMRLFDHNGVLVTDEDRVLLGKTYHIDENGVIEGYMTPGMWEAKEWLDENGWDLWTAYTLAASIPYSNRWLRAPSGAVHTEYYADYGFTNETGNCYVMNCMLYQMAKLLGYEVYFVEGAVAGNDGVEYPHGWCEIIEDGTTYVYDSNFYNETGRNGYRIQYQQPRTWLYLYWHTVD